MWFFIVGRKLSREQAPHTENAGTATGSTMESTHKSWVNKSIMNDLRLIDQEKKRLYFVSYDDFFHY
jgi:hypothetical protein